MFPLCIQYFIPVTQNRLIEKHMEAYHISSMKYTYLSKDNTYFEESMKYITRAPILSANTSTTLGKKTEKNQLTKTAMMLE